MGEHLRHKEKKTDRNRYFLPIFAHLAQLGRGTWLRTMKGERSNLSVGTNNGALGKLVKPLDFHSREFHKTHYGFDPRTRRQYTLFVQSDRTQHYEC